MKIYTQNRTYIVTISILFILLVQVSWANDAIPQSAENIAPLTIGDTVSVDTWNALTTTLNAKESKKPLVVIFYRGGWCPYCNSHLKELQAIESDIIKKGYTLLAVSPDKPSTVDAHKSKKKLPITLVSNSDMSLALDFGIAFQVPKSLVNKYLKSYSIDLEGDSGKKHNLLPVPSVFIIDRTRVIHYVYTNANYKVRLSGVELLKVLDTIK
ncbi:MAG: AhpC/TSA family protein [Fibrobacterales bacterium]